MKPVVWFPPLETGKKSTVYFL